MSVDLGALPPNAMTACVELRDRLESSLGRELIALWAHGAATFPDPPRRLGDVDTHGVLAGRPGRETVADIERIHADVADVRYPAMDSLFLHTTRSLGPGGGTWVVGDSLVVVVDGLSPRAVIYRIGPERLDEVRVRRLPGGASEVTAADRAAAERWFYWSLGTDPTDRAPEDRIVEFGFPAHWSAWSAVRSDDQENVWLKRGGPRHVDPAAGEVWVRWSLQDDSMVDLAFPPAVEVLQFREGHVVGVRRDGLGVETVVVYRIVAR